MPACSDEILADDWEDIPLPPGTGSGRENFKAQGLAWMRTIFPDLVVTNEDILVSADGSKVAVRSVDRGTECGAALGIPATGKRAEFRAFDIHHLKDGVMVKTWHLEDFFGWSVSSARSSFRRSPEPTRNIRESKTRKPR